MPKVADAATAIDPNLLKAHGYTGIIRYAGRSDVNISKAEYLAYRAHGLLVGIVNEYEADFIIHASGVACAQAAQDWTRQCGIPDGPIYFAGDFNLTLGGWTYPGSPGDANVRKAAQFLTDAASLIGWGNVGFYGSYFAAYELAKLLPNLHLFWQTEAWSDGLFYAPADLYQYAGNVDVPGIDRDAAVSGYWGYRANTEKLSSQILALPLLEPGSTGGNVKTLQHGINVAEGSKIAEDGVYGPITTNAVRGVQIFFHLPVDGIAGPQTDRGLAYAVALKGQ